MTLLVPDRGICGLELGSGCPAPGRFALAIGAGWPSFSVMVDAAQFQAHEHASENVGAPLPAKPVTNLSRAFDLLFARLDYRTRQRFQGRHKAIVDLLHNRAKLDAIRNWQDGRRPTPRWVRKIVHDELQARASAMQAIAVALAAEQDGSKPGDSLRRYWQKKKAAAIERPSE